MSYGVESRSSPGSRVSYALNGNVQYEATPAVTYDMIFSYRTGLRSRTHTQKIIKPPGKQANLRERLQYKVDVINAALETSYSDGTETNGFRSGTDSGHEFASFRMRTSGTKNVRVRTKVGSTTYDHIGHNLDDLKMLIPNFSTPLVSWDIGAASTRHVDGIPSGALLAGIPSVSRRVVPAGYSSVLGTKLIASTNPWTPKANLSASVIELLQGGLPSVTTNIVRHLNGVQSFRKTAGADWLNYQFGWVPLANDIRTTVQVLFGLHELLFPDSVARRKRSGSLGSWGSTSEVPPSNLGFNRNPILGNYTGAPLLSNQTGRYGAAPPNLDGRPNLSVSRSTIITADWRFSARFHRGAGANRTMNGYLDRAIELLGLEITPATLWEITPWSWLLDWSSSLGAVARNLTSLDASNVLLDYAYMTFCSRRTSTMSVTGASSWTQNGAVISVPERLDYTAVVTEKLRQKASPYGFSVSWNGLSPYQLSILGALGLSRAK